MPDTNSYRRKAEKYKRSIVSYEYRLESDLKIMLDMANSTEIQDGRSTLIDYAKRTIDTLLSELKSLRGF